MNIIESFHCNRNIYHGGAQEIDHSMKLSQKLVSVRNQLTICILIKHVRSTHKTATKYRAQIIYKGQLVLTQFSDI